MSLSNFSHIAPQYVEYQPLKENEKGDTGQVGTVSFLAFSGMGFLRYSDIAVYRDVEGRIRVGIHGVSYRTDEGTTVTSFPLRDGTKANLEQQVEEVLKGIIK